MVVNRDRIVGFIHEQGHLGYQIGSTESLASGVHRVMAPYRFSQRDEVF